MIHWKSGAVIGGSMLAMMIGGAAFAQTGNPGGAINDHLGDRDYGVCRGIDPVCYHNWPRPKVTQYRVLLFTHTAGPRHADLGPQLKPGLNPALTDANVVQHEMLKIAEKNGWHLDYTEDDSVLTRDIKSYNAVVFYSTSRQNLDDAAKTALRQYMRAGGGFVAIHNAFGTMYNWPYYEGLLGNANYYNHGPERTGDVVIVDSKDASTKDLPKRWKFEDEWYNLIPFPTKVRFLAVVDEKSWGPAVRHMPAPGSAEYKRFEAARAARAKAFGSRPKSVVGEDPGHGSFHPVAWCQYYDGGKAWMTTLGHDKGDFANDDKVFPGSVEFVKLIVGGIKSVMGEEPFCQ